MINCFVQFVQFAVNVGKIIMYVYFTEMNFDYKQYQYAVQNIGCSCYIFAHYIDATLKSIEIISTRRLCEY